MTDRAFRFGVVAGFAPTAEAWTGLARRAEDLGYSTLLQPDTLTTLSPFSALAAAAAVTENLRLGTFVLSVSNREPGVVAWETATLDLVSGGRFEIGLGGGRPGADNDAATLGRPFGAPAERVRLLEETIAAVKAPRDSHVRPVQTPHPPVLVPAGGPKVTRIAVEQADIVTVAIAPTAGEEELAERVGTIKSYAGERFDRLELSTNLLGIGTGEIPGRWTAEDLAGSASVLTGSVDEMTETLRRRRDALGISYVSVNAAYIDDFAPVVERLAGS